MNRDVIIANAKIVVREAMSEPDPLPLISAAALAGNGWQENLMQPVTRGQKDHGSDGLLQWRLDRLVELQRRKDWDTLPVQVRFFKDECQRDYPGLWRQLANPGNRTIENLVANITDIYERPSRAGRQLDKRIAYAKQCFSLFDTSPPKTNPPPIAVQNAQDAPSSSIGLLAILAAFLAWKGVHIPLWALWGAFGLALIFFVNMRKPHLPSPTQEAKDMDPAVIIKIFTVIEALVPLIEKAVAEIPQIKADIDAIKSTMNAPKAEAPNFDALIEKLNQLGGPK